MAGPFIGVGAGRGGGGSILNRRIICPEKYYLRKLYIFETFVCLFSFVVFVFNFFISATYSIFLPGSIP